MVYQTFRAFYTRVSLFVTRYCMFTFCKDNPHLLNTAVYLLERHMHRRIELLNTLYMSIELPGSRHNS